MICMMLVLSAGAYYVWSARLVDENVRYEKQDMGTLLLTSLVFEHNGVIPAKYTCDGDDINPPLEISGAPEKAKSLVLIMDDPDVPKNLRADGMWVHWVVFNIPPDVAKISENTKAFGVYGKGTSGEMGYQGPCPPDREHRYFFKVYALDVILDLKAGAMKEEVETAMNGHVLDKAEFVGLYERATH